MSQSTLRSQPITLESVARLDAPSDAASTLFPEQTFLPDAYRLPGNAPRGARSPISPQVVFFEVTNRCNLLCETCPRTYFTREPLKSLTFEEFKAIADQFPMLRRAVLHGIGEPLLNKELPEMIRLLKDREVEVLFNSNGTLLTPAWQEALIESGLDEFRCSIDGAEAATYAAIRGADLLHKIVEGLDGFRQTKERMQADTPRISIWCVATTENLGELPDLVRMAADLGVPEVYVQRMVYFASEEDEQYGMARSNQAIFGPDHELQETILAECEALSRSLDVDFRASGARDPRHSLAAAGVRETAPWQACMRPWTTAYITANGNCLPCCISPFTTQDYESILLGNLFARPFAEIWEDYIYQKFRTDLLSENPHKACANCGVHWSL